ncbi:MAG TPA: SdrD B-like domain-containing protein [Blastocatellia bacterium]|nr:SdrD B-like domain-containing protein [Blastocatellia bacterium]
MGYRKLIKAVFALALVCAQLAYATGLPARKEKAAKGSKSSQSERRDKQGSAKKDAAIMVNDRALAGPFSSPQRRGSRVFLPVVAIARALGDTVSVNPQARSIEVHRQTGAVADFSAQLNQIRENGTAILVVSNTADIVFPPNADELMLPVEIVAPMLDVSIVVDEATGAVKITRGLPQTESVRPGAQHAAWELYQVEHATNVNVYSRSMNYNTTLHSTGRINDGKFDVISSFDGGTGQSMLLLRRGSFAYDRPNGERFILGDFGTGNDLEFMSSTVRGLWAQKPVGEMRVSVLAGRTMSDASLFIQTLPDPVTGLPAGARQSPAAHYDTNVFGSYLTFGPSVSNPTRPTLLLFSAGAMYFNGPLSSGESVMGSVRYNSRRHQFQGDFGAGNFSGLSLAGASVQGRRVEGFAAMLDVIEVFNLSDSFTLQGRVTRIGSNFLGPQSSGLLTPVNLASGGVTWRPAHWFGASVNAMKRERPDLINQRERSVTASVSVTPRGWMPTIIFTHTQGRNALAGKTAYTLLNVTKEFNRWRVFGNYTRIQNGAAFNAFNSNQRTPLPPSANLTGGAMVRIGDSQTLQFSQSFGTGGTRGGAVDWATASFFTKRISLGAGFTYNYSGGQFITTERFLTTINLPRQQALQFTYVQTPDGPQIIMQLRGPIFSSPRAEIALTSPVAELNSFGAFYGKVYQDINLNGQFDAGVDKPQANVQIRVDGSYFTASDADGNFKIENVRAGEHIVYLDLLSVRADLTLLDSPQQTAMLKPGRDSIVDFRLVRTGRIKGVVWMDANGNGVMDKGELPISDVRVVTGSGRDTLTDENGEFVLGDLPPGEHVILIDEKTLPENTKPAANSLQVIVKAGSETDGVSFPVVVKPIEVDVKRFPSR